MLPAVLSARKSQGAFRGPGLEKRTHSWLTTVMQLAASF